MLAGSEWTRDSCRRSSGRIQTLNAAINQALGEEAIATRIHELGASPRITTPAETLAFIKAERADFGAIAKAGKISVE